MRFTCNAVQSRWASYRPIAPVRCAVLIRRTILVLALAFGLPAEAAEPVFPPGSRIGLVPPAGMAVSKLFQGFEDRQNNASIIFVELSGEAYPEIEKSFAVEALRAQGIDVRAREELPLKDGHGFLVIAHQALAGSPTRKWALVATEHDLTAVISVQVPDAAQDAYPDAALRASLATFITRAAVPVEELGHATDDAVNGLAGSDYPENWLTPNERARVAAARGTER